MILNVIVKSKTKTSMKKFLNTLNKLKILNFSLKNIPKKNNKSFVTVLKSPHINKTSQEQFEFRFYTRKIQIITLKPNLFLYIIKKLQKSAFSNIYIKIETIICEKQLTSLNGLKTEPDNFNFVFFKNYSKKSLLNANLQKNVELYLNTFSVYGEFYKTSFASLAQLDRAIAF